MRKEKVGPMARECIEIKKIEARATALVNWLEENAPSCKAEQKHLDEGSQERAYWHYGHLTALRDVLRLLAGKTAPSQRSCRQGISRSRFSV